MKILKFFVKQDMRELSMLVKLSSRNQITIPKKILSKLPPVKYFEVSYEDGVIILRPVQTTSITLTTIREKIKKLGLSEDAIAEAIECVRKR